MLSENYTIADQNAVYFLTFTIISITGVKNGVENSEIGGQSQISSKHVEELAQAISEKLDQKSQSISKVRANKLRGEITKPSVEKENLEKYEKQESILGQRNSYSKTDNDQALNCSGCPLIEKCTKGNGNRTVSVNPNLEKHKEIARKNLSSEKGKVLRKRRAPEIETFFGDLKHNQKYRRIRLRGLDKANLEMNYLAISYNLRKAAKKSKTEKLKNWMKDYC
jgi:hypothetical protein